MRVLVISAALGLLAACGGATDDASVPVDASEPATTTPVETPAPEPAVIDVTGEMCGGIAAIQCPSGYFCKQEAGQCLEIMDGSGTCQPKPTICTQDYRPVCGCDGQTYSNSCTAEAAGVSVAFEGECAAADTQ